MLKGQSHKLPTCLEAYQCPVAKPMVEINLSQLQEGVRQQLVAFGTDEGSNVFKSKKLLRYEYVFYSNNCSRVRKRNSYTVKLEQKLDSDEDVVQVKYYLLNDKNRALLCVIPFKEMRHTLTTECSTCEKLQKK